MNFPCSFCLVLCQINGWLVCVNVYDLFILLVSITLCVIFIYLFSAIYVDGSGHMKLAGMLVWDVCVIYLFIC